MNHHRLAKFILSDGMNGNWEATGLSSSTRSTCNSISPVDSYKMVQNTIPEPDLAYRSLRR